MEWGAQEVQAAVMAAFGAGAAAVFLYLARDALLRRRTDYDGEQLESKRDRDREKYGSDWGGDEQMRSPSSWAYEALGLEPGAAPEQVRSRYRQLAKRYHPDRDGSQDAAERMARINSAYEELSG